ncbi:unnamed protein product [Somion occarium]|uniref:DUF6699 domain-containing protein n=1 Tax=Somion occarium TaxID=3059160 RepID=A0ABP1DWP7_9APHY
MLKRFKRHRDKRPNVPIDMALNAAPVPTSPVPPTPKTPYLGSRPLPSSPAVSSAAAVSEVQAPRPRYRRTISVTPSSRIATPLTAGIPISAPSSREAARTTRALASSGDPAYLPFNPVSSREAAPRSGTTHPETSSGDPADLPFNSIAFREAPPRSGTTHPVASSRDPAYLPFNPVPSREVMSRSGTMQPITSSGDPAYQAPPRSSTAHSTISRTNRAPSEAVPRGTNCPVSVSPPHSSERPMPKSILKLPKTHPMPCKTPLHRLLLPYNPASHGAEQRLIYWDVGTDADFVRDCTRWPPTAFSRKQLEARKASVLGDQLTHMTITCERLPFLEIYVDNPHGITCKDVFEAIYKTLNVKLTEEQRVHWERLQRRRSVKRVDLLGDVKIFMGLQRHTDDSNPNWQLKLGRSDENWIHR